MGEVRNLRQSSEMVLFFRLVGELIDDGMEPEDVWFDEVSEAKIHIGFNFTFNGHEYSVAYGVGTYTYTSGESYRLFNCAAWHGNGERDICEGPPTRKTIGEIKKALEEHDKECDWPRLGVSAVSD